ncbi:Zinc finger protein 227 [Cricetulus griseus]|uniref:Zinc finger protein 227 n=1 Tax=Cricetulus griseus TaxID=10029 RepID=G3IIX2_CRIGR|nr:Zinc finger protein 227 [Cricetulus griseus]
MSNHRDASVDSPNPDRHESRHTGEELLRSKDCEKSLNLCYNITQDQRVCTTKKEHRQGEHNVYFSYACSLLQQPINIGENRPKCETCGKCFSAASSLTVHERIHTGTKPYKCNIFEKSFTQIANFQAHQRVHTGEKPYKCNECGKSFPYLAGINSHQKSHTGEKPYKCNDCDRSFRYYSSLSMHRKTHSLEKLHKCKECGHPRSVEEAEAFREDGVHLSRVPEQNPAFRYLLQNNFCSLSVHHTPGTGIPCDLKKIPNKAVCVIDPHMNFSSSLSV